MNSYKEKGKGKKQGGFERDFLHGYALALGFIMKAHGQGSMVRDAMKEHGITIQALENAECDDFDMDPIRKEFNE